MILGHYCLEPLLAAALRAIFWIFFFLIIIFFPSVLVSFDSRAELLSGCALPDCASRILGNEINAGTGFALLISTQ